MNTTSTLPTPLTTTGTHTPWCDRHECHHSTSRSGAVTRYHASPADEWVTTSTEFGLQLTATDELDFPEEPVTPELVVTLASREWDEAVSAPLTLREAQDLVSRLQQQISLARLAEGAR